MAVGCGGAGLLGALALALFVACRRGSSVDLRQMASSGHVLMPVAGAVYCALAAVRSEEVTLVPLRRRAACSSMVRLGFGERVS